MLLISLFFGCGASAMITCATLEGPGDNAAKLTTSSKDGVQWLSTDWINKKTGQLVDRETDKIAALETTSRQILIRTVPRAARDSNTQIYSEIRATKQSGNHYSGREMDYEWITENGVDYEWGAVSYMDLNCDVSP